jgi:hypothetical protein
VQDVGTAVDHRQHVGTAAGFRVAVASEVRLFESAGAYERRKPAHQPAVVHRVGHHGSDAGLQRVVIAERYGRGRIIAVKHRERTARPQHTVGLRERPLWFRHV